MTAILQVLQHATVNPIYQFHPAHAPEANGRPASPDPALTAGIQDRYRLWSEHHPGVRQLLANPSLIDHLEQVMTQPGFPGRARHVALALMGRSDAAFDGVPVPRLSDDERSALEGLLATGAGGWGGLVPPEPHEKSAAKLEWLCRTLKGAAAGAPDWLSFFDVGFWAPYASLAEAVKDGECPAAKPKCRVVKNPFLNRPEELDPVAALDQLPTSDESGCASGGRPVDSAKSTTREPQWLSDALSRSRSPVNLVDIVYLEEFREEQIFLATIDGRPVDVGVPNRAVPATRRAVRIPEHNGTLASMYAGSESSATPDSIVNYSIPESDGDVQRHEVREETPQQPWYRSVLSFLGFR